MEEHKMRTKLDDYRIAGVVGKGSYGEVSLVTHRAEGKQYVIKKLNLRIAPPRERKAAQQEAQLLSELKHPNIVAYKESWEGEDGLLYIVMGYCEGGDLYHKLKEQKGKLLPESQVVEWFVQIAMALQYLHDLHIMHRDLKTQNIFLTKSNIIKVGDMGIARVLESKYDMASTLIGTPYYMSPELFSNKPYNYKSDVWALGCCVYEMATLKHAFNAKDMNALVYRIIEGKLPPMPKDYSKELGDLIGTMLSRQPEKRPTVRHILRNAYIKEHIALFLQNTKLKQVKRRKKMVESNRGNVHRHDEKCEQGVQPWAAPDNAKLHKVNKMKSPVKTKAVSPAAPVLPHMNNTVVSISTLSRVDIDILPDEKKSPGDEHLIPEPRNGCTSKDTPSEVIRNCPQSQDTRAKPQAAFSSNMDNPISQVSPVSMKDEEDTMKLLQPGTKSEEKMDQESMDSTDKLLEPFVPVTEPDGVAARTEMQPHISVSEPSLSRKRRQKLKEEISDHSEQFPVLCPRPLPSPPVIHHRTVKKTHSSPERKGTTSVDRSNHSSISPQDNRPLSARERRRLKQSQEEVSLSVPSVRRGSAEVVHRAEEMYPVNQSLPSMYGKKQSSVHLLSEDDLSSSTSSTDKSEGDCKERKNSDSGDMNDLVSLMTQTLHMEKDKSQMPPAASNEFRLHRKYRDTLMLHGRAAEDPDDIFQDLPSDNVTVSERFRRVIEALRADVVHGLGVKVLEEVHVVLNKKDESHKELQLQKLLGEKYDDYNQKIHQLKFFEDNFKL